MSGALATGGKARRTAFRLAPPPIAETALHASIAAALHVLVLPPAMWTTFPAGSVPLPPQFAAKLTRLGLQRGWPDVLIACDGRIFGLEIKRIGGALSKTRTGRTRNGSLRIYAGQDEVFPRLAAAGMQIAVVHSVDEALAALRAFGVPLRRCAA